MDYSFTRGHQGVQSAIQGVTAKRGTVAEKHKINAKGFGDKTFTRNDLQKVIGEVGAAS